LYRKSLLAGVRTARRQEEEEVARINVSGNDRAVVGDPAAAGLNVVFGGVEVYEVRAAHMLGWRKALIAGGMILLLLLAAAAWLRSGNSEMTPLQFRQGIIMSGLAALYAIWALRQVGIVWRFDHKRHTITRRHWLRGMSRNWKSSQLTGLKLLQGKSRLGGAVVQLGLVDASGKLVAEVGCWNRQHVDISQIEAVAAEIKKVMWWR
jgi:hypothetical protein